jgi:CRISPR-associated protein Csh1
MIDEIISFEKALKESGDNQQYTVPNGIYILFSASDGNPSIKCGIYPYDEDKLEALKFDTEHLEKCATYYPYTTGLISNKRHDRKNESCSLFSFVLRLQAIEDITTNSDWNTSVANFKSKASAFFDTNVFTDKSYDHFISFMKYEFELKLEEVKQKIETNNQKERQKIKVDKVFTFFETKTEYYKEAQNNCLQNQPFSTLINEQGDRIKEVETFNVSDLLSGFSERKEFLIHKTAAFKEDYKIPSSSLSVINDFFTKLKDKNKFPKPLPIFIDRQELNRRIISIYQTNKGKLSFADVFERIYQTNNGSDDSDLQSYYLLYAQIDNKKLVVKDLEYVPSFEYKLNYEIKSVFETEKRLPQNIDNVFEFQRTIIRELFDNCLFKKDEKTETYTNNYWGEVKAQFCKSNNNFRLILLYRKAFYDFVYKSKHQTITSGMLKDIVLSGITDVLKDEKYRPKNNSKEERIKTLLNIYFNIYTTPHCLDTKCSELRYFYAAICFG